MERGPIVDLTQARRTRADTFAHVYSNHVNGRISQFDIVLTFSHIRESGEMDGQLQNHELVSVSLSPQQFKLMATLCSNMIQAFEKVVGPVVLPADAGNPRMGVDDIAAQFTVKRDAAKALRAQIEEALKAGGVLTLNTPLVPSATSSPSAPPPTKPAGRKLLTRKKKAAP